MCFRLDLFCLVLFSSIPRNDYFVEAQRIVSVVGVEAGLAKMWPVWGASSNGITQSRNRLKMSNH